MTLKIVPVLMVGGSGTRLWPVSRQAKPKQFQALLGKKSLFQETVLRVTGKEGEVEFTPPVLIGAGAYEGQIREQLAEIGIEPAAVILEPSAQNTAAVVAVAARFVEAHYEGGLALLLPSDAYVETVAPYRDAIAKAAQIATEGWITTFGIAPDRPETGFGYIQSGDRLGHGCHSIKAFREKPDVQTAKRYVADTDFSWNSGIFLFAPATMVAEMKAHANDVLEAASQALEDAMVTDDLIRLDPDVFSRVRKVSVDYAVMEHTSKAAVYSGLDCGWSDVGGWQALARMAPAPSAISANHTVAIASETSYFRSDGSVLVTGVGLEDMIVVAHEGAVLVLPKSRAQDVKAIIKELEARGAKDRL